MLFTDTWSRSLSLSELNDALIAKDHQGRRPFIDAFSDRSFESVAKHECGNVTGSTGTRSRSSTNWA